MKSRAKRNRLNLLAQLEKLADEYDYVKTELENAIDGIIGADNVSLPTQVRSPEYIAGKNDAAKEKTNEDTEESETEDPKDPKKKDPSTGVTSNPKLRSNRYPIKRPRAPKDPKDSKDPFWGGAPIHELGTMDAVVATNITGRTYGLTQNANDYLKIMSLLLSRDYPKQTLNVNSGFRRGIDSAEAMAKNWETNGGKKPLRQPINMKINGNAVTIKTEGTHYLVRQYADDNMAYKFGTALETESAIDGQPPLDWLADYWNERAAKSSDAAPHVMGIALDFDISKRNWDLVRKSQEFAKIKIVDESDKKPPCIHVEVNGIKGFPEAPKDTKDTERREQMKQPQASNRFSLIPLTKQGFDISVEPYQSMVNDAIKNIQQRNPNYFQYTDLNGKPVTVKHVVLEAGAPGHFGKVQSDKPDTIFVSFSAIENAINSAGSKDPEAIITAIQEVLFHEMGHLKDNFKGGEGPAEAEANKMKAQFATSSTLLELIVEALCESGYELHAHQLYAEASLIDAALADHGFIKKSFGDVGNAGNSQPIQNYTAEELAQSIIRLVFHFKSGVKTENQHGYIDNIKRRLSTVNTMEIASKRKNPGAGVGATISVLKNILGGANPQFIQEVLTQVIAGLDFIK